MQWQYEAAGSISCLVARTEGPARAEDYPIAGVAPTARRGRAKIHPLSVRPGQVYVRRRSEDRGRRLTVRVHARGRFAMAAGNRSGRGAADETGAVAGGLARGSQEGPV